MLLSCPAIALKDVGEVHITVTPEANSEPPVLAMGEAGAHRSSSSQGSSPAISTISSVPANSGSTVDSLSGQIFIPVPTIMTAECSSDDQLSFPVPALGSAAGAIDVSFNGHKTTSTSNAMAPDSHSIHVPTRDSGVGKGTANLVPNSAAFPVPISKTADVEANSVPGLPISVRTSVEPLPHIFRTNILEDYGTRHPLISRNAYESEV